MAELESDRFEVEELKIFCLEILSFDVLEIGVVLYAVESVSFNIPILIRTTLFSVS